jgi:hypothetical protein
MSAGRDESFTRKHYFAATSDSQCTRSSARSRVIELHPRGEAEISKGGSALHRSGRA